MGFDKQFGWVIPESEKPLMWAEGRRYFYKGGLAGEARGGDLYSMPVLSSYCNGLVVEPVKIKEMIEKNASLLNGLVQKTLRYIHDIYKEYSKGKADIFYTAFSGGKDSIVLLDLVQKALPHDAFKVVFADTSMELDDTLKAVENAKVRWNDLDWYTASSHMTADESWRKIGPPAERMRWCCSIHKTAPQVLLIKELAGTDSFKTLAFVGVRAEESDSRSAYEMTSEAKKHIMQTSCCPILDWNTSELFLYIFQNNLLLNKAYRKGFTRAGCVFCPMSSKWSSMLNGLTDKESMQKYTDIILETSSLAFNSGTEKKNYFNEHKWKMRMNGRDLKESGNKLNETVSENGTTEIVLSSPNTDWKIWLSAVGNLHKLGGNRYDLEYEDIHLNFTAEHEGSNVKFVLDTLKKDRTSRRLMRLFKNALYKAVYCIHCKVCEVECPTGALKMTESSTTLQNCSHCGNCLNRDRGCIVAKSRSVSIKTHTSKKLPINPKPEPEAYEYYTPDSIYLKQRFVIGTITPKKYKKAVAEVIAQCKNSNIPLLYMHTKNEKVIRKIFADYQRELVIVDFSSLDVYTSDGQIHKCQNEAELLQKLEEINASVFSCGLEQISTNDTLLKPQGFRETAAQMGVTAATNISGSYKYLNNLIDENIWTNPDYYVDNPDHIISKMKLAVEKTIEDGFRKNNMVCIADIWATLESKPFGLQNCPGSLFITGFLLKEYANGYKFDGANTVKLDAIGLSDIIFGVARDNPKMKGQFIVNQCEVTHNGM